MPHRTKRQELIHLLATKALHFGKFTLPSGEETDYLFDCRKVAEDPRGAELMGIFCAMELVGAIPNYAHHAMGGPDTSSDFIVKAVYKELDGPFKRHVHCFHVMDGALVTSPTDLITDPPPHGSEAVIFDDVVATGATIQRVIDAVMAKKSRVAAIIALIDRQEIINRETGLTVRELFESRGFTYCPIFMAKEILAYRRMLDEQGQTPNQAAL